ncbi:MAG TPA: FecR domain-containing protein [Gemmatimonadaceae bacterium]|jgi:ferric-dicitrate binding protein FerR (iron transport regulator)|nr:FecR domain-containing protein [Gemmatimonadaceae bacterium]
MRLDPDALSDDRWEEITDYVSDQATSAATAAMRERVAADPVLALTVAPLRTLWHLLEPTRTAVRASMPPLSASDATARDTAHTAAAWARLDAALTLQGAKSPARPPVPPTPRQSRSMAPQITSWWRRPWVVASGIACLLLLGAGMVFRVAYPALRYQGGTLGRVVTLPDRSIATLASGAYLGTSHAFTYGTRDVYLFGQAHFQVSPDPTHPFIVHVVGVDATALGTTFGMTSDTLAHVTVDVTQGKIALLVLGKDGVRHPTLVLSAGQVRQIPALTQWMTEAGGTLGAAGLPFATAVHVHDAMMRAAAALATSHR